MTYRCNDCKDTGVYTGLLASEPCRACGGKVPHSISLPCVPETAVSSVEYCQGPKPKWFDELAAWAKQRDEKARQKKSVIERTIVTTSVPISAAALDEWKIKPGEPYPLLSEGKYFDPPVETTTWVVEATYCNGVCVHRAIRPKTA